MLLNHVSEHMVRDKLKELPSIELSYETFSSHKKMSTHSSSSSSSSYTSNTTNVESYQVGLFIPKSKKYIAWFTFIGEDDVCILLEMNREKQVVNHRIVHVNFDTDEPHLALGTFFYGSLVDNHIFIIEDILMYKAVSLRKLCFGDRLGILHHILAVSHSLPTFSSSSSSVRFMLPVMFSLKNDTQPSIQCGYSVHHVQYRSFTQIIPYLNFPPNPLQLFPSPRPSLEPRPYPKEDASTTHIPCPSVLRPYSRTFLTDPSVLQTYVPNDLASNRAFVHAPPPLPPKNTNTHTTNKFKEPVGRERAIFLTTADMQSDIYHLVHPSSWYMTDVAYIPNYKTSVMMNRLFRNIKENDNLDAMEDSDDEDDFHDIRYDKYVNLTKQLTMECMYHKKFRRWIPLRVIS